MRGNPFVKMIHSHFSNRAKRDTRLHSLSSLRKTWLSRALKSAALGLRRAAHPRCHCLGRNSMFLNLLTARNEATLPVSRTHSLCSVSIRWSLNFTLITLPSLSNNIPPWPISFRLSIFAFFPFTLWSDVEENGCALMSRDMQCSTLNGRLTFLSSSTLDKKMTSTQQPCYKASLILFWWEGRDLEKKNRKRK